MRNYRQLDKELELIEFIMDEMHRLGFSNKKKFDFMAGGAISVLKGIFNTNEEKIRDEWDTIFETYMGIFDDDN